MKVFNPVPFTPREMADIVDENAALPVPSPKRTHGTPDEYRAAVIRELLARHGRSLRDELTAADEEPG